MRRFLLLPFLLAIGCAAPAASPAAAPHTSAPSANATAKAGDPSLSYDANALLDLRVDAPPRLEGEVAFESMSFASPRGGRVPALLVRPATGAPGRAPGIVLQHGMGNLDKTELLPDAVLFARAGAVAILVDGPMARPPSLATRDYADHDNDSELFEHAAVDLRRAIDVLLSRPDVDPTRVGYVGHSFGGTMGAILAHVEPRVKAFILIGTGASLTREILESPGMAGLRAHVPKSALDAYAAAMGPFDAERHLAEAAPTAHVFFQFGSFDEVVDASEASKSVAACRAVTETRTYPTGHFVTSPAAARDRLAFFARELLLPRAGDAMNRELGS